MLFSALSALFLIAFAPFAAAGSIAAPADVPKNQGWVTDLAELLPSAKEQQLEELMESYKQGSSHEIALLTVPSLEGETIESFALKVGRSWGIGGAEAHNGALFVVSSGDRKMRIEVGRGLEGNLTDAVSSRIIRDVVTPAFREGRFADGIEQGVRAMHAAIGGDYGALPPEGAVRRTNGTGLAGLALFVFFVIWILGQRGGRVRRRRGGIDPWLAAGAFSGRRGHGPGSFGGGGGFSGFGGGGGFSGGGASGGW